MSFLAVACAPDGGLPAEARDAVDEAAGTYYVDASFGGTVFDELDEIRIVRAWRADDARAPAGGGLWCLKLAVTGQRGGVQASTTALWIVGADGTSSGWAAAALETISASVTQERCGQGVP